MSNEQTATIINLPVENLHPHPNNPRKDLGDLTELADSIRAKGILQNLTVVPMEIVDPDATVNLTGEHYTIIIGHRRFAASKQAGLKTVPCAVADLNEKEQIQTMLLENMQRSDLTPYEQAKGFQMMLDLGETMKTIPEKTGFSAATVRSRMELLKLNQADFEKATKRGATLMDFAELNKIDDLELRNAVLKSIGTNNFRNELKNAIETDKHNQRMAQWKIDVAGFAQQIEKGGYVGEASVPMDYVRTYDRWTKDATVERPNDLDTVKYYYCIGDSEIVVYKERQPVEVQETEEDRARKAAQKDAENRYAEIKAISKRHYSLRAEFISKFGKAKKYIKEIACFAVCMLLGDGDWRQSEADVEFLSKTLGIAIDENDDYETLLNIMQETAAQSPEYVLLVCAYSAAEEDVGVYFTKEWNTRKLFYDLHHKLNSDLDRLYNFLVSLGYEMSDEELQMQEGTHPLFSENISTEKEEDADCAACKSAHPFCDKCCNTCDDKCNSEQVCRKESEATA